MKLTMWPLLNVAVLSAVSCLTCVVHCSPSHVVFIVADDMGWNDIGYHNPDIITPVINDLARTGVILNQSYVQPVCSPSRSALMTGVYPFRLGLQHVVIIQRQGVCAPLNRTFLPQVLQRNGYATHAVGKWHLGFCKWECTPTYRGFDSFYGYYNGAVDHYAKVIDGGYDFHFNTTVDRGAAGTYGSELYANRAVDIIKSHNPSKPLFLYLAFQNVHWPLQAPEKYLKMYSNITDSNRRYTSAMATDLDDAIGRVVKALKDYGLYDDTTIVFTSDNGGETVYGGNNFPLRGGKISIFEGGTRVPGFIHGKLIRNPGRVYNGMMHIVDWFPTLMSALNIKYKDPQQDGVDQWKALNSLSQCKRNEIVYNIDLSQEPVQGQSAIRVGDYKLIEGFPGLYQEWYRPGVGDQGINDTSSMRMNLQPLGPPIDNLINNGTYRYLFNIKNDPTERNNLYEALPEVVKRLSQRLGEHKKKYVPPNFPLNNPKSDPSLFGGVWTPGWC